MDYEYAVEVTLTTVGALKRASFFSTTVIGEVSPTVGYNTSWLNICTCTNYDI